MRTQRSVPARACEPRKAMWLPPKRPPAPSIRRWRERPVRRRARGAPHETHARTSAPHREDEIRAFWTQKVRRSLRGRIAGSYSQRNRKARGLCLPKSMLLRRWSIWWTHCDEVRREVESDARQRKTRRTSAKRAGHSVARRR